MKIIAIILLCIGIFILIPRKKEISGGGQATGGYVPKAGETILVHY